MNPNYTTSEPTERSCREATRRRMAIVEPNAHNSLTLSTPFLQRLHKHHIF
jgi:hypothetical protein